MVSGFVEGATLDKARLNQNPETLAHVARALRQVHRFGRAFMLRFDVFTKMDDYLTLLSKLRAPLPKDFGEVKKGARAIRRALESSPMPLAPCHNDTWPPNFLDAGGRIYIIDWEFSGMNDPMWDLADLSVESRFGPEQDRVMMEAYRGALSVPPALYARLALYKIMSDLLWTLWGMIEHANGNPADDFRAYALRRLEHCKEQMGDAGFGEHLALVARGSKAARSERPAPSRLGAQSLDPRRPEKGLEPGRLPALQAGPQRPHAPRSAPAKRAGPLASPGRR